MAVRFVPFESQYEWIPVLQFPVNLERIVRLCPDRIAWRTTELHWDDALGKTVPCSSDGDCPYCPRPIRRTTYVPALEFQLHCRKWLRRIMPFTDSLRQVLELELDTKTFKVFRRGRSKSPVQVLVTELGYDPPRVPPFSIEASLMRMWGCQRTVAEVAGAGYDGVPPHSGQVVRRDSFDQ